MDAKEQQDAWTEARRELAAHPDRTNRHAEVIRRYIAAAAYEEIHRHREPLDDEDPRPVDEPAPPRRPRAQTH